jgi:hypothetical protein
MAKESLRAIFAATLPVIRKNEKLICRELKII